MNSGWNQLWAGDQTMTRLRLASGCLVAFIVPNNWSVESCPPTTPTAITAPGRRPKTAHGRCQHLPHQTVQALKHQFLARLSHSSYNRTKWTLLTFASVSIPPHPPRGQIVGSSLGQDDEDAGAGGGVGDHISNFINKTVLKILL